MKVVLLSGGGGGARFAGALAEVLGPGELTIIGNVGDDEEILGLHVSPDLDGLLYALSGLVDDERGWGRAEETWNALEAVSFWGGEDWFRLGDRDLGIHLVRTQALHDGRTLSEVTARFAQRADLAAMLLPATDDRLRTFVATPSGSFAFQEWFVGRAHADEVVGVIYAGADRARAAPGVTEALGSADVILLAPSNPYLSIGPILAVAEIRRAVEARRARCVAISPLVAGAAVTGPLDRMLSNMAGGTTPAHVAARYEGLVDALVIDESDAPAEAPIELVVARTLMERDESARSLAKVALEVACG